MAELHGPGSTESRYAPEPYVRRIDKFIGDLYYFYQYILDESEWCCGKPGLFDLPQNIVPVKAIPGKATPVKAIPWKSPPVPKKRPLEDIARVASAPPSEDSSVEETPAKKSPPPLPKVVVKTLPPPPAKARPIWPDPDRAPWVQRPPPGREPGKVAGPVAVAKDPRRPSVPYPQPAHVSGPVAKDPRRPSVPYPQPAHVSGPVAKDPRRPSVPYPQGGSSVPEPESEAEEGGSSNPRFGRSVPEQADPRRPSVPFPAPVQNLSPSVPAPVQGLSPSVPLPLALVSKPNPPAGPFTSSGPKPPSYPPPADPLTWGPNPPSYPPPADPLTWIPKPPSDHHREEAAASSAPCEPPPRNRWNRRPHPSRVPVPFLFVEENKVAKASTLLPQDVQDVIELDQENAPPAVAIDVPESPETTPGQAASDPPTPVPVSRVPSARAEDVAEYDAYQKHVQNIVKQWLAAKQSQHSNPKYEQNALTSFLLMVLISSFLETAQDAAKQTYAKLHGSNLGWWEDPEYKEIDQLGTRKFCQHKRQGQVWRFLKSVDVVNFEPDNPGDIKGWNNWLSREQLISAMEFCFATFWKNKLVSKEDKKNVLHNHLKIYWNWLEYLWEVQPDLKDLDQNATPWPSGWTWEGFMEKEKAALVEKAAEAYIRKLGNCESLAKLYTHLFAKKIQAFEECNVDIDDEGSLPADVVLNDSFHSCIPPDDFEVDWGS